MSEEESEQRERRWRPARRPDAETGSGTTAGGRRTVEGLSRDIAHFARLARGIVDRGKDRFFADSEDGEILRRAGRNLVTEFWAAVERLPDEVVAAHPEIPTDKIKAMRNRLAHHYENVDDEYVWAALGGRFQEVSDSLAEYRTER